MPHSDYDYVEAELAYHSNRHQQFAAHTLLVLQARARALRDFYVCTPEWAAEQALGDYLRHRLSDKPFSFMFPAAYWSSMTWDKAMLYALDHVSPRISFLPIINRPRLLDE